MVSVTSRNNMTQRNNFCRYWTEMTSKGDISFNCLRSAPVRWSCNPVAELSCHPVRGLLSRCHDDIRNAQQALLSWCITVWCVIRNNGMYTFPLCVTDDYTAYLFIPPGRRLTIPCVLFDGKRHYIISINKWWCLIICTRFLSISLFACMHASVSSALCGPPPSPSRCYGY